MRKELSPSHQNHLLFQCSPMSLTFPSLWPLGFYTPGASESSCRWKSGKVFVFYSGKGRLKMNHLLKARLQEGQLQVRVHLKGESLQTGTPRPACGNVPCTGWWLPSGMLPVGGLLIAADLPAAATAWGPVQSTPRETAGITPFLSGLGSLDVHRLTYSLQQEEPKQEATGETSA